MYNKQQMQDHLEHVWKRGRNYVFKKFEFFFKI
jgi:hypothetical protein